MMLKIKDAIRKLIPPQIKGVAAGILTAGPIGAAAKKKGWIRCKRAMVYVDHPRISNQEAAAIFFGIRERAEIDLAMTALGVDASSTVVELGCSIGVVASNLASLRPRRLILVEPDAELLELCKTNLGRNVSDQTQVTFLNRAIDYSGNAAIPFQAGLTTTSGMVSLAGGGGLVDTLRLSELLERCSVDQFILVSDIEGAEADIWFSDADALGNCLAILVELEDTVAYSMQAQIDRILSLGFVLHYQYGRVFLFKKQ